MIALTVNGKQRSIDVPPATPLLYVLRNDLGILSPQFGCGLAQCGACSVLVEGKEVRACVAPVTTAAGKEVTTVEGLPDRWAKRQKLSPASREQTLHPVQTAWIEQQTPLCEFCQNSMMIKATELLESNPTPSSARDQGPFTTSGPSAHLCRCRSYIAIMDAVRRFYTQLITKKAGAMWPYYTLRDDRRTWRPAHKARFHSRGRCLGCRVFLYGSERSRRGHYARPETGCLVA